MRLIVNGQQAFGQGVLEALLKRGDEVVGVFCAPDREGRPPDPLKTAAEEHGLPVHQPESFKDPATLEILEGLKPDLCLMAYVTLFVPEAARDIPTRGSICFHPSLLPRHRGPSSINWPIMAGETKTGLTIFYPDDGLDEGDILLQKEVDIGPDDTLGTVYFKKIFPLGVEAMLEATDLIGEGRAPRIPQDHSLATYESWCRKEHAEIDWRRNVHEVYNLIRGTNPQPGAWTTHDGERLDIFDSVKHVGSGGDAEPGTVTAVDAEGLRVAAKGGEVGIKRVRPARGAKITASEFAADKGLAPGARLG